MSVNEASLELMLQNTLADPTLAFETDNIAILAELKHKEPAKYERTRISLKEAGVRITELEKAIKTHARRNLQEEMGEKELLVGLTENLELFHTPDKIPFATIGSSETTNKRFVNIRSSQFKKHLALLFFNEYGIVPGSECLRAAIRLVEAKAIEDGEEHMLYTRFADLGHTIYLDLANSQGTTAYADLKGWSTEPKSPPRFWRPSNMAPLPLPCYPLVDPLLIKEFFDLTGIYGDDAVLIFGFMVGCFQSNAPKPILQLIGPQGSGKSTIQRMIKQLLDPSKAPMRSLPGNEDDLIIAAQNAGLLSFDNVSSLTGDQQDALCRLVTGGGIGKRTLYSDADETVLEGKIAVMLNGITEAITRPDLKDRTITIYLKDRKGKERKTEKEILQAFEQNRAIWLSIIISAIHVGLSYQQHNIPQKTDFRMADFSLFAERCSRTIFGEEAFEAAYERNLMASTLTALEHDPVASGIIELLHDRAEWTGTATDLLRYLEQTASTQRGRNRLPDTPATLSRKLNRIEPLLRQSGIIIDRSRSGAHGIRRIRIVKINSAAGSHSQFPPALLNQFLDSTVYKNDFSSTETEYEDTK